MVLEQCCFMPSVNSLQLFLLFFGLLHYRVSLSVTRLHLDKDGRSPLEKFSQVDEDIVISDFHTCGCPVYILDAENQSGAISTPKWEPRSHIGI